MDFIKNTKPNYLLLIGSFMLSILYFYFVGFVFTIGNAFLFVLLILGSIYHLLQVFGFIHTVWPRKITRDFDKSFSPSVGVYITVCGEPTSIVEETLKACLNMQYPNFSVYILNDGLVAKKDNWRESVDLANKYGIMCITRKVSGGAKAGNINHALLQTSEDFIAVFDADHIPKPQFLTTMMGYFVDTKVGFVQSPQFYKNRFLNQVTLGAWEQQALFFGAILKGKNALNSTFMCGTNMVVRRKALESVGGMNETNIAEDFLTSLLLHEKKWNSVYVDSVLAEGLSPEDFLSYYKQQFRWARGSLEVVFTYNPFFRKGLTFSQKFQYFSSASYYLSGLVVAMNALLPLIFFYTGLEPLKISSMTLALVFLPYIFVILANLQNTSNFTYTFRALCFSMASFPIYIQALLKILAGQKSSFAITSKTRIKGNFMNLVTPHLAYIVLAVLGVSVAIVREGFNPSLISNIAWTLVYIALFIPFIKAALEHTQEEKIEILNTKENINYEITA